MKSIISLIAILGLIGLRILEIVYQLEGNLYLNFLLGGIAIGVSHDEFVKIIELRKGKKE